MKRRTVLAALPALSLSAAFDRAGATIRARIVDVTVNQVRLIRDLGVADNSSWMPDALPGSKVRYSVGGRTITRIVTDQGVVGMGPGVDPARLAQIKAALIGRSPLDIEQLISALYVNEGDRGAAAVEIALWDAVGQLAGEPLYRIWGGTDGRVTAYCSFMSVEAPQAKAEKAALAKAQGFRAAKLRASLPTVSENIALVERVRAAVGPDFKILVDGNKAYGNRFPWSPAEALEIGRAYQGLGVHWFEEPLPREAISEIAGLNRALALPLAGGENVETLAEYRLLIAARAYDILNCEPVLIGPVMTRRVQALAAPEGVDVVPHHGDSHLGTIAQLHLTASFAGHDLAEVLNDPPTPDYAALWEIFDAPPKVTADGSLRLSERPGLGLAVLPDLIGPPLTA